MTKEEVLVVIKNVSVAVDGELMGPEEAVSDELTYME